MSETGFGLVRCEQCRREIPVFPQAGSLVNCPCGSTWILELVAPADARPHLMARLIERGVERGATYAIVDALEHVHHDGRVERYAQSQRYIMCLHEDCPAFGRPSFNRNDAEQRYCGGCHRFHLRTQ